MKGSLDSVMYLKTGLGKKTALKPRLGIVFWLGCLFIVGEDQEPSLVVVL